jgi:hypothetical protein
MLQICLLRVKLQKKFEAKGKKCNKVSKIGVKPLIYGQMCGIKTEF